MSLLSFVGTYFLRSFRSLLRPKACLFALKSFKEVKCTGTQNNALATLFCHALPNSTPVIPVSMSIRTDAIPI